MIRFGLLDVVNEATFLGGSLNFFNESNFYPNYSHDFFRLALTFT